MLAEVIRAGDLDRLFPPDPATREIARGLYDVVRDLPLVSPHGHVDASVLADDVLPADAVALLIAPDHYVTRMLFSQGVRPHDLGVPTRDGVVHVSPRRAWRTFWDHWFLFRGTPSRLWMERVLIDVLGVPVPRGGEDADHVFDAISARLADPAFRPRALLDRFGVEVLATTDSPLDPLDAHARLAADGWGRRVIPTFRPDDVVDPDRPDWAANVDRLGEVTGEDTSSYVGYVAALERRRSDFAAAGATATDHGHPTARTVDLSAAAARSLFSRLRAGRADPGDAETFRAHMLVEFARMSVEDGLVMQLHPGSVRNHSPWLYSEFGPDTGADIPAATDYVSALAPLLRRFGTDRRLRLIVFTLDESAYSRELAPLAGVYPAMLLGPAWWFFDSPDGMRRYRELTTETAGFYNTVGFTDDTRAFFSIPVRHNVARRVDCAYLAGLVADHRLPRDEAEDVARDLAYALPRRAYRLDER